MLQSLPKSLLSFRRQTAERGIALECVLLFGRRQVFIPPKPVSGMTTWLLTHLRLPVGRLVLRRGRRRRVSVAAAQLSGPHVAVAADGRRLCGPDKAAE